MIVKSTEYGWDVIHQQAHGLLAVQAALHWHPDQRPSNWVETLIALTEHDDGQDAWEGRNHLTEAGAPKDFQILTYSVFQMRKMVEIALEKSRWNALLVSRHASFLYESMRGTDPALDEFLDDQTANQKAWMKVLGVKKAEVDYAYAFLQWCDALSLILCLGRLPDESRRLEISLGPDGQAYFILQRPDQTLAVEPWPFDCDRFSVHVESYPLHQLQFTDDAELYQAIQRAPVNRIEWTFQR